MLARVAAGESGLACGPCGLPKGEVELGGVVASTVRFCFDNEVRSDVGLLVTLLFEMNVSE